MPDKDTIYAVLREIEELHDAHPLDDFDRGWEAALICCEETVAAMLDEETEEADVTDPDVGLDHDAIHHPSWYTFGGIETLDYIIAKQFDFLIGQVCKYISRAGLKDPDKELEDLEKAETYLRRKIDLLRKQQ